MSLISSSLFLFVVLLVTVSSEPTYVRIIYPTQLQTWAARGGSEWQQQRQNRASCHATAHRRAAYVVDRTPFVNRLVRPFNHFQSVCIPSSRPSSRLDVA